MGKRHHASRRRAYGRRQHEVRERSERPGRDVVEGIGIVTYEAGSFDELVLDRIHGRDAVLTAGAVLRSPLD